MAIRLSILVLCLAWFACEAANSQTVKPSNRQTSHREFVRRLGVGINIGNTLECPGGDEREWGNAPVTKDLLDLYKTKGIRSIRLPVTWARHFKRDEKGHRIDDEFMAKVDRTVRLCLAEGFYVILDVHHDGGEGEEAWLILKDGDDREMLVTLRDVWRQIAANFADCGERLLFEAFNEVKAPGDWCGGAQYAEKMRRLAYVFYRSVRGAGGENARRWLVIPTYAAAPNPDAVAAWKSPAPEDGRILADVHMYVPGEFAVWGKLSHFTDEMREAVHREWRQVAEGFARHGVGVVAGEVGAEIRFHDGDESRPNTADRLEWARENGAAARESGIAPFLWDSGGDGSRGFPLADRQNFVWRNEAILDGFLDAYRGNQ